MYSHCAKGGGWILGNLIDGTQAEHVRIPFADTSLYHVPKGSDEDALVMLSDILPTGFECGVLKGQIKPGDTVAIIGAGPVGLAVLMTAQFYSPAEIILVDLDDNRLEVARKLGATKTVNSKDGGAVDAVRALTAGRGVDVAVEAVGIPATFEMCQDIVAAGGFIANVGVHGKPVELPLQDLWISNIVISMGLVNTNTLGTLLKLVAQQKIPAEHFISHTFALDNILEAYDVFGRAAETKALKVMINA